MLGFAAWAGWRWSHSGALFFLLLVLRDTMAAWFLMTRQPADEMRSLALTDALAYFSCALSLFYLQQSGSPGVALSVMAELLPIFGFTLATLALLDLGASFGVAPANRGRVGDGVYRVLNHPMYVGYAIAEASMVLLNPANAGIYLAALGLYWWRASVEERVLRA